MTDYDSGRWVIVTKIVTKTVTKIVTDEMTPDEETQKVLKKVVSRLGLEPRALALKAPTLLRKINAMTLRNRPMRDKHLQRVTICTSYIGQTHACGAKKIQEVSSSHTVAKTSVKLSSSADTLHHVPVRLRNVP